MDDLRIRITAGLQEQKSINEINNAIKKIENHPSLEKINLKIQVDEKFIQSINKFTSAIDKLNSISLKQADVSEDVSRQLKNETQQIDAQTDAINRQAQALKNLKKEVVTRSGSGEITGTAITTGDQYRSTTEFRSFNDDGTFVTRGYREVFDAEKQRRDAEKLANQIADGRIKAQEKFNKLEEQAQKKRIDAAHRLALIENKKIDDRRKLEQEYEQWWLKNLHNREQQEIKATQRAQQQREKLERETEERWLKNLHNREQQEKKQLEELDKAHALALIQNQRREQDFLRKQQETINKIETARLKYGHHKGVNEALDLALVDAKSITSVGDYNNALKNVNSTVARTTAGLKAARMESLSLGDALQTALTKFPIDHLGGSKTSLIAGTSLEPLYHNERMKYVYA